MVARQLSDEEITKLKELVNVAAHNGTYQPGDWRYPGWVVVGDVIEHPSACNICNGTPDEFMTRYARSCFLIFCLSHARQVGLLW